MSHPFKIALETGRYNDPLFVTREVWGGGWLSSTFKKVKNTTTKVVKTAKKSPIVKSVVNNAVKPYYNAVAKPVLNKAIKDLDKVASKVNLDQVVPGGALGREIVANIYKDTLSKDVKKFSNQVLGKDVTRALEKPASNLLNNGNLGSNFASNLVKSAAPTLGLSETVKGNGLRRKTKLKRK